MKAMKAMKANNFTPPPRYRFPANGEYLKKRLSFPASRWFEYHGWESEQSSSAKLWSYTHQRCTVLRRLTPEESDYEMYEIQFGDGFTAQVFADEILGYRTQFERPDYKTV